jgi:hypothetical protein
VTAGDGVAQLRSDVERWRERLQSEAEATYCQGVANRAAKLFEALLKRLAERRVAATGRDLGFLLLEIKYTGGANTIDKLPLGTVTQLVIKLTDYDDALVEACTSETRIGLTRIVDLRNTTTHELAEEKMRATTVDLLDVIDEVLRRESFARLL